MSKNFHQEITELIIKNKPNKKQLASYKNKLCKKYKLKKIPIDINILLNAKESDIPKIKKYLITKPTRTISGVAIVAIMTKPFPCPHGKCIMCPGGPDSEFGDIPQSYTGKEPATRRAIRNKFDPYLQVINRLEQYIVAGHVPDKIELIIMGGTFPSFPKRYKDDFIKYSLKAMNDFSKLFFNKNKFDFIKFKKFFELPGNINDKKRQRSIHKKLKKSKNKTDLIKEQKINEKSNIKCVGLTIETRPDFAMLEHAFEILNLGATRVELGVQTIYEEILGNIHRGHTVKDSIDATQILKDLGFKVNYHIMPGLPGVTKEKDIEALKEYINNANFRPDMFKLYPCMVLKGTKLYSLWKKGKFKPLTTKQAANIIIEFKKIVPEYVRIVRILRDIPTYATESGVDKTNLRQYIETLMKKKKIKCRCIRCRESGHVLRKNKNIKIGKIKIKTLNYKASKGLEFFISAEDDKNNILFGFCRLRFPSQFLRKEITKDSALIRELHIYSPSVKIGEKSEGSYQHRGLGKQLLKKAEKIAQINKKAKIVIISGIGARSYFRKFGYKKEGPYMTKPL